MKKILFYSLALLITANISSAIHSQRIDSIAFFTDEPLIEVNLTTDIKGLQSQKGTRVFLEGNINMKFADGSVIESKVGVAPRGINRREYCKIPPMMLNFRQDPSSKLSSLGNLKLVLGCGTSSADEELLLKEFVVYKIYNMLESKSFRVRLLKVNYADTKNRVRPFTQYSFLIEDDGDLARRNGCKKKTHSPYLTEATDRNLMTKVAVFQYMAGNTDWAVPNEHNIKLIFDRNNTALLPYVIPYDFDYCGLVDAPYAVPNEIIGTETVTERVYRGFPRTMEELQETFQIFRDKQDEIMNYIRNFSLLSDRSRKSMIGYLEDFYRIIESRGQVSNIFIDGARTK